MSRHTSQISMSARISARESGTNFDYPVFPKKLPELRVGPVFDESGFTLTERLALRQAWRLIKPFERRYGQEIYFPYLMEHYQTFEHFRYNGKLDIHKLHSHLRSFMRFSQALIEQDDPTMMQVMLTENNNIHTRCRVSAEDIQTLIKAMIKYILEVLRDISSASLESGFQKLLDKFDAYNDTNTNKRTTFLDSKGMSMSSRSVAINANANTN
ncbi:uncharacterized protein LOC108602231 [Drosophila busckii]|uniref:uncharacterized protein LOC108602231 n=1 Tax=Drosophila busckii TaxID=30019 RepID=UPI00083EBA1A|nr:uncharacterized protein LOC108602231 [Drosophila busckii]